MTEITEIMDRLFKSTVNLEQDGVTGLIAEALKAGIEPVKILERLQGGVVEIGNLFAGGDYFISELIFCGEIMKNAMAALEPYLSGMEEERRYEGTIVLGTVQGDIHDLGKNLVAMFLRGAGYKVMDIGVDAPPARFINAVVEHKAGLVGMSVLLTGCHHALKNTVTAIREAGLKEVKTMIGGNYVNEDVRRFCGADYFGSNAADAVSIARKVIE